MRKKHTHVQRITPRSVDKEELDSFLFTEDDFEAMPIGSYVKILQTMAYGLPIKEREALLHKYYVGRTTPATFVEYVMKRIDEDWTKGVSSISSVYQSYASFNISGKVDTFESIQYAVDEMVKRLDGYSLDQVQQFIDDTSNDGTPLCALDSTKLKDKALDFTDLGLYKQLTAGYDKDPSEAINIMMNGVSLNEVFIYFMKMYGTFIHSDIYKDASTVFSEHPDVGIDGKGISLNRVLLQEDLDRYTRNIVWVLPDDRYTVGSATMGRIGIDPLYDGEEKRIMVLIPDNTTRDDVEYIIRRNVTGVPFKVYTAEEYNISLDVFDL